MEIKNLMGKIFKNFIKDIFFISIFTFISLEVVSRLLYWQPINDSSRKLHNDGLLTNKEKGNASHSFFNRRKIKYYFGDLYSRIENPKNILGSKENFHNKCEYLVLGDSFAFGHLIDWNDIYVTLLEKKINNFEITSNQIKFSNSSTQNWGLAHFVFFIEKLEEEIKKFDGIIIFINADDAVRAVYSYLYEFEEGEDELIKNNKIPEELKSISKIKKITDLPLINDIYSFGLDKSNLIRLTKNIFIFGSPKVPREKVNQKIFRIGYRNKVEDLESFNIKYRKKLNLILKRLSNLQKNYPPITLIYTGTGNKENMALLNKKFIFEIGPNLEKTHNIKSDFSLKQMNPILETSELILNDGHPTENGHKKIAKAIFESKDKNGIRQFIKNTCN